MLMEIKAMINMKHLYNSDMLFTDVPISDTLWIDVQNFGLWMLGERKTKKVLTTIKPLVEPQGKAKFCAHCGKIATQEALFKVNESVILIEKYCDNV